MVSKIISTQHFFQNGKIRPKPKITNPKIQKCVIFHSSIICQVSIKKLGNVPYLSLLPLTVPKFLYPKQTESELIYSVGISWFKKCIIYHSSDKFERNYMRQNKIIMMFHTSYMYTRKLNDAWTGNQSYKVPYYNNDQITLKESLYNL